MKMRYTVEKARAKIENNGGKVGSKQVRHTHPGISVLGAIDYLVNHCGYTWIKSKSV